MSVVKTMAPLKRWLQPNFSAEQVEDYLKARLLMVIVGIIVVLGSPIRSELLGGQSAIFPLNER